MLRLEDNWVWDFWLARDGDLHHIFFLKAPRSLGDPERRHGNATIGHAVSDDLREWRCLPDAMTPGMAGSWDDMATWTGSVIRHGGEWWCFYTAVNWAEKGLVQRIGAATSTDLTTWTRRPENPLIELDDARYEALDLSAWHDQAWRDPWVMRVNGHWEAFITARTTDGAADARGVIARATSPDLIDWSIENPVEVTPAGQYGHLEVPQVIELSGRWYLVFCTDARTHSQEWRDRGLGEARTGTYYAVGDTPTGPFTLVEDGFLGPDDGTTTYSGRIVEVDGDPMFLAWRMFDAAGDFVGEIIDPLHVRVADDGRLILES